MTKKKRPSKFDHGFFVAWDGEGERLTGSAAVRAILGDYPGDLSLVDEALAITPEAVETGQGGAVHSRILRYREDGAPTFDGDRIASEVTDLLYWVYTLGSGALSDRYLDEGRARAATLLAADCQGDGAGMDADERALLCQIADRSGTVTRDTLDALRDKRLRGRTNRPKPTRRRSTDGLSLAGEEGAARLREYSRVRRSRPKTRTKDYNVNVAATHTAINRIERPNREPERGAIYHAYNRLAASWTAPGEGWQYRELVAPEGTRLRTPDMLRFMLDVAAETGWYGIHVGYYLSYDFTHILRDLSAANAAYAITSPGKKWGAIGEYEVKLSSRKQLQVRRQVTDRDPKTGKRRKETVESMTVWDVSGFFQSSFTKAVEMWLGADYPDLPRLRAGKSGRSDFATWSDEDIADYNRAELRALVTLMDRVREAVRRAGYVLSRWDGAGALASAFYGVHVPREFWDASQPPTAINQAARYAYFGGRIEYIRFGHHTGSVWHGDINSAYPAAMATIPDLARGRWIYESAPRTVVDFALYRVTWSQAVRAGIGPFPFRLPDGRVLFPSRGAGWYWGVEVSAALDFLSGSPGSVIIHEGWIFTPDRDDERPFGWIETLYRRRAALVEQAKHGDPGADGEQKILKLGLNSLYGKTVQRVGYIAYNQEVTYRYVGEIERTVEYNETEKRPPFYNIAIGGYITAHCRAALLRAAASNPSAVITFATDGIYATAPLSVPTAPTKILGLWEVEIYEDAQFIIAQPGVYYVYTAGRWSEACRGFPPAARAYMTFEEKQHAIEARAHQLIETFRAARTNRGAAMYVPDVRFVTLKQALMQGWGRRGEWVEYERALKVYNASPKRTVVGAYRSPARGLIETVPNDFYIAARNVTFSEAYSGLPDKHSDIDNDIELERVALEFMDRGLL